MSDEIVDVEVIDQQIVPCPKCGQQNRIVKQIAKGIFKCGVCQNPLVNPFVSSPWAYLRKKPVVLWGSGSVLIVGFVILFAVLSNQSESSAEHPRRSPNREPISKPPVNPWPAQTHVLIGEQPVNPPITRSLPISKVIVFPRTEGKGSLKISNGTKQDAYVKLIARSNLVASFYVKSEATFTLEKIPDESYKVEFALGEDWDSQSRSFTQNKNFERFDGAFLFETITRAEKDGIHTKYTVLELTLHAVVGGTAKTRRISEEEFGRY